jgi:hypothetical protein
MATHHRCAATRQLEEGPCGVVPLGRRVGDGATGPSDSVCLVRAGPGIGLVQLYAAIRPERSGDRFWGRTGLATGSNSEVFQELPGNPGCRPAPG